MEPFGFIYLTTNLINGKRYIGQSSYSKKNHQRYLGSGKYLLKAIKKYGSKNFSRIVLCDAFTREDLSILEMHFITEHNAINDPIYYNVAIGGYTTRGFAGKKHTDEYKLKMAEYGRTRPVTENMRRAFSETGKRTGGFHHTEKHKAAIIRLGKQNKGKKWYNNGIQNFSLFPNDSKIEELKLTQGVIRPNHGQKNIGKKWYNDGHNIYSLFPNDPKISELNLVLGNIKQKTKGRKWYNDGVKNFLLYPDDPKIQELCLINGMINI